MISDVGFCSYQSNQAILENEGKGKKQKKEKNKEIKVQLGFS